MLLVKLPKLQFVWLKTCNVRVYNQSDSEELVEITKINSFTHSIEGRKRVKLVVTLVVTPEGKKKIEEEIEN